MSRREIRVAGVQFSPKKLRKKDNLSEIIGYIKELARRKIQLTVFPECSLTGYALKESEVNALAETVPGPSTEEIQEVCRRESLHTVIGLIEKDGNKTYNTAVLVSPNGIEAKYRETHLPYQGVDKHVNQGQNTYMPLDTDIGKIGILICYDIFFPETVRALTLSEVELIVVLTNWAEGVEFYADHIVYTRAIENHVNIAAINRVGTEGNFRFYGKSSIIDPSGRILASASNNVTTLIADINMDEPHRKRIVRIPGQWEVEILKDRRPELYSDLIRKT